MMRLLFLAAVSVTDPLAIQNETARITIDPASFGIASIDVRPRDAAGRTDWSPVSTLSTDAVFESGAPAARPAGPAEILERTSLTIALESPPTAEQPLRWRMEVSLDPAKPVARYRVSVQPSDDAPAPRLALRNTARIPQGSTLRISRGDATIRVLKGADTIEPAVVRSRRWWLIPVPPTAPMRGVVLGSAVSTVILDHRAALWTRRVTEPTGDAETAPHGCPFVCLLDDATQSYGASLAGGYEQPSAEGPAALEEEWTFETRGR